MNLDYQNESTNVLVIGSGGSGLRAAIEVAKYGLSVKVLGKRLKEDVHTSLAAGGINASFGNIDNEDSWEQHFADTYIEGYSIGQYRTIEIMAKEAPTLVNEIESWGANFNKLNNGKLDQRFFGAHTYRRTCYSADFTGKAILNALIKKANDLSIKIEDTKYVTDLLIEDNQCFGAFCFDINNGKKTAYLADAVVLATGGNTRIWKRSTSRKDENNGDGIYLGLKAGCKIIDMEMVQFHPTGMVYPDDIAGTLVTEAVRGEGGILFNKLGERFMEKYDPIRLELSTRDRIAMANYKEIIEGRGSEKGGVFLDISHIDKEIILKKLPSIYRQFIEYQMLDISSKPMEVAPTAHYSMGGIYVKPDDHSTNIKGLFACGEVAGGLHGANRLGGNSLAEILIFGKRVGGYASIFSKGIKKRFISKKIVDEANFKINSFLRNGNEIIKQLEKNIQCLMWDRCGVLRDKDNLIKGIEELNKIKTRFKEVDVRISNDDFSQLVLAFNLESSIYSAEATLKSALAREESIGSHQRRDFPNENKNNKVNYLIHLDKSKNMKLEKEVCISLPLKLQLIVDETKKIHSLKGKLIE